METKPPTRMSIDECKPTEWDRAANVIRDQIHRQKLNVEDDSEEPEHLPGLQMHEGLYETFENVVQECYHIMKAKNHDYAGTNGDVLANFRAVEGLGIPMELGILIRVMDKFKRLQTFIENGELKVKGEGVGDAIRDVINYMILIEHAIRERETEK